jgi:hypothetical protein
MIQEMRKMYFFILLLLLINPACSQRSFNRVSILTNDSLKYWEEIWKKPYFENYRETGLVFFNNGRLLSYFVNNKNERVIIRDTEDVICEPEAYTLKYDTLFIDRCGYRFAFSVKKLTKDSLELKEISKYGYFPNLEFLNDTMSFILVEAKDQITKLIDDNEDYTQGPVKVIYNNN